MLDFSFYDKGTSAQKLLDQKIKVTARGLDIVTFIAPSSLGARSRFIL